MINHDMHLHDVTNPEIKQSPIRVGFGEGLVEAGAKDPNIVALSADLVAGNARA